MLFVTKSTFYRSKFWYHMLRLYISLFLKLNKERVPVLHIALHSSKNYLADTVHCSVDTEHYLTDTEHCLADTEHCLADIVKSCNW